VEICNEKSHGTFVTVDIIRFESSKVFAPRSVVSLQLLCLIFFLLRSGILLCVLGLLLTQ